MGRSSAAPSACYGDGIAPPIRVLEVMEATIGGTKRHLNDLVLGLQALAAVERDGRPITAEVACPLVRDVSRGDTSLVSDLRQAGVSVHLIAMTRAIHPLRDGAAFLALVRLIRRGRYDVVHAHSSKAGALARPAVWAAHLLRPRGKGRRAKGRPAVVYTPHGFAFQLPTSPAQRALYFAVEWACGWLTDYLIGLSPTEVEVARRCRIVPRHRIRLIENGIDLRQYALPSPLGGDGARAQGRGRPRPPNGAAVAGDEGLRQESPAAAIREELGWGDAPVVGTVGWLTRQKDPATFLRAAARVAAARPDARFAWCGSGELEGEARALAASLGIADRVQFLGYRPDARAVLAAYDVFVLASRFEGVAYSPLDAMALERPVVATAVTGTRDTVVDGVHGYLVPPGDATALADRILTLVASPDRREAMGRAGRQLVERRFRAEQMVAKTAALYRELAAASATMPDASGAVSRSRFEVHSLKAAESRRSDSRPAR